LASLKIDGCLGIGSIGLLEVMYSLKQNPSFAQLSAFNIRSNRHDEFLSSFLDSTKSFNSLNVMFSQLSEIDLESISNYSRLQSLSTSYVPKKLNNSLEHLVFCPDYLDSTNINPNVPFADLNLRSFSIFLAKFTSVQPIAISCALALESHLTLERLHLPFSPKEVIITIAASMKSNNILEDLDLEKSDFDAESVELLMDSLKGHVSLHSLSLSECKLPPSSFRSLADLLLDTSTSLTSLNVKWGALKSDPGILDALGESLEVNSSLRVLVCGPVQSIEESTLKNLVARLQHNVTLVSLRCYREFTEDEDKSTVLLKLTDILTANRNRFKQQARMALLAAVRTKLIEKNFIQVILDMACQ
jgi:hypothetical protein